MILERADARDDHPVSFGEEVLEDGLEGHCFGEGVGGEGEVARERARTASEDPDPVSRDKSGKTRQSPF